MFPSVKNSNKSVSKFMNSLKDRSEKSIAGFNTPITLQHPHPLRIMLPSPPIPPFNAPCPL